ncbi:MAG: GerMN domain-containing protein [bacterium]|nr:GerMN domain-containing protein [bacterium]
MNIIKKGFANITLVVLVVILAGAVGYFVLRKPVPITQESLPTQTQNPTPTSVEAQVRTAVEKVLAQGALPNPNEQMPKNIKLLSVNVVENKVTLNFSKEITSKGQGVFENIFSWVSNAVHPIIQGKSKDPKYPELKFTILIEGKPTGVELTNNIALSLLKTDLFEECRPERVVGKYGSCTINISKEADGWVVVVTYDGLYDDSVKATRTQTTVTYQNGQWVKGSVSKTQQCWSGRGHQDFSAEACL